MQIVPSAGGVFGGSSGEPSHRLGGSSQAGEVTVIREPSGRRAWLLQVMLATVARACVPSFGTVLAVC